MQTAVSNSCEVRLFARWYIGPLGSLSCQSSDLKTSGSKLKDRAAKTVRKTRLISPHPSGARLYSDAELRNNPYAIPCHTHVCLSKRPDKQKDPTKHDV